MSDNGKIKELSEQLDQAESDAADQAQEIADLKADLITAFEERDRYHDALDTICTEARDALR